jgi:Tfp pilus assembly protein PilV
MRGFTLMESLLALVICATGVLGIASLLLHGLSLHGTALSHESATALLADMHETLIANPPDATAFAQWQTRAATELPSFELGPARGAITAVRIADGSPALRIQLAWGQTGQKEAAESSVLHVATEWIAP